MAEFEVNLAAECGDMPSGADMAGYNGYSGNLTITVTGVEGPADLLRHIANMWDLGTVKPGESYTLPKAGAERDG